MENSSRKPKIRFKGFNDDWEQRKLGDLLQTLPFKQFLKEPEPDGKYEIIQQGNEPVIGFANGIPCGDYKNVVIFGDHTLSLYKPQRPFFVATDGVRIVKGQIDTNGYYLLSLLERYKPQSEGYKRYFSILTDTNCITTYNASEQKRIGTFFKRLDNLITLHQRKCDKLIEVKKFLLKKMFPEKNSKIPQIRFKGFTNDWEQRKLEEIGNNFSVETLGYADLSESGIYKCVLYGDLYTKFNERIFDVKSRTNKEATKVEINDILFPTSTTVDALSLISPSCVNEDNIRVGGDLFGIRPYKNIDGNFVSYCINNYYPIKYSLSKQAQGLTIVHLQYNSIKNEMIMLPSLMEQNKMSDMFICLDNLITLHQRKLEKLKNLKKSLLDNMFV